MKKLLSIIFIFSLFVSFQIVRPVLIHAQVNLDPCNGVKVINGTSRAEDPRYNPCLINGSGAGTLIRNLIVAILIISAVVALLFLIWGGFKWITSGGDKTKVQTARDTIIAAIIGLIIAFLAYFILTVVLGLFGISLGSLSIPKLVPDNSASSCGSKGNAPCKIGPNGALLTCNNAAVDASVTVCP